MDVRKRVAPAAEPTSNLEILTLSQYVFLRDLAHDHFDGWEINHDELYDLGSQRGRMFRRPMQLELIDTDNGYDRPGKALLVLTERGNLLFNEYANPNLRVIQ